MKRKIYLIKWIILHFCMQRSIKMSHWFADKFFNLVEKEMNCRKTVK